MKLYTSRQAWKYEGTRSYHMQQLLSGNNYNEKWGKKKAWVTD